MSGVEPNALNKAIPPDCEFAQLNLEAYVLNALDSSDQSRIDNHLRWCDRDCPDQVREFRLIVDVLPFSVDIERAPSASVLTTLMARVEKTSTAVTEEPVARISTRVTPPPVAPDGTTTDAPRRGPRRMIVPRWVASAFVAPLIVALIVVSAWGVGQYNRVGDLKSQLQSQGSQIPAAMTGDDVRLYTTKPACADCSGSGQLGADPSENRAVLLAWDLNPSETHEVWCVHSNGETSLVATLNVNKVGQVMQMIEFPRPISGYSEIQIVRHTDSSPELIFAVAEQDQESASPTDLVAGS
ncbi:MAG TPA: hypothetical protein VFQ54_10430 [Thermomicrobiales bacterium]|nr:hypothetical protein [Thermomicrobiales bacterium]